MRQVAGDIPYEVRRNKRRRTRMGLVIDPRGFVIVDAPESAVEGDIVDALIAHQRWLRHRLSALGDQGVHAHAGPPELSDGELVPFRGGVYPLAVTRGPLSRVTFEPAGLVGIAGARVAVAMPADGCLKEVLRKWYRHEAAIAFGKSLAAFADLPWIQGKVPPWRQRWMKSQWGSCSASGRLSLNTHLVKVPEGLLDYVVLHELCHLVHMDHSKRFYGLMSEHMSDWPLRREQLNRYLSLLLDE